MTGLIVVGLSQNNMGSFGRPLTKTDDRLLYSEHTVSVYFKKRKKKKFSSLVTPYNVFIIGLKIQRQKKTSRLCKDCI